jgi:2-keto-4-pentenoate hydratase/2-oxohepta-3-ene-1,7-dioic acid hydratase in catechol pathway
LTAKLIEGKNVFSEDCTVTGTVLKVEKLLGPLTRYDVPTTRCIGLNYAKHSEDPAWCQNANQLSVKEGGRPIPPLPTVFFKGSTSIAGHGDVIEIPKICQDDQADYEGELVVVMGKDAKNVSKENALDYVLGYTAGNDVSSR